MHGSAALFPSIPASVPFDASAVAHAHRVGVNVFELDAIAQVISRLARDDNTVVPASMEADLTELQELGYVELSPTTSGTVSVNLLCPGALLSSYFWSVWVPRHLLDRALKVSVLPYLDAHSEVQYCTVVFRIPGSREATREFLTDLGTKFPGHEPEIIAIQVGNGLEDKERTV